MKISLSKKIKVIKNYKICDQVIRFNSFNCFLNINDICDVLHVKKEWDVFVVDINKYRNHSITTKIYHDTGLTLPDLIINQSNARFDCYQWVHPILVIAFLEHVIKYIELEYHFCHFRNKIINMFYDGNHKLLPEVKLIKSYKKKKNKIYLTYEELADRFGISVDYLDFYMVQLSLKEVWTGVNGDEYVYQLSDKLLNSSYVVMIEGRGLAYHESIINYLVHNRITTNM